MSIFHTYHVVMKPNDETRTIWAEKTFELTNIATSVLLFGQFLSDKPIKVSLAIAGLCFFLLGYGLSLVIMQKKW